MAEQDERWEASIIDAIRHTSERYDALSKTVEQAIAERNQKLVEMEAKIHQNLATVEQLGQRNLEAFNVSIRKDVYATMRGIQLSVLNVADGQKLTNDRLATLQTILSEAHGVQKIVTDDVSELRQQVMALTTEQITMRLHLFHVRVVVIVTLPIAVPLLLWLIYLHL